VARYAPASPGIQLGSELLFSYSVSREFSLLRATELCHRPIVLFLSSQGASGVGLGNFLEVGPLDVNLKPRNSTWLQKADLIFVVSPRERQRQRWLGSAPLFFHELAVVVMLT
jgi:hypothetical protein